MFQKGVAFADALAQAQALGYAEADPTADVEGHDACRKICILSNIAYGDKIDPNAVSCEGISKIALEDVQAADALGCVIKLLGRAVPAGDGGIYAYVAPHLISRKSPLASVDDVFNAIMVTGNALGEAMFYGKGAGKLATASAVVADMMDAIAHEEKRRPVYWGKGEKKLLRSLDSFVSGWYVRFAGAEDDLKAVLGACEVIASGSELIAKVAAASTAEMAAKAAALAEKGAVRSTMRML